jgi:hypothetical protein
MTPELVVWILLKKIDIVNMNCTYVWKKKRKWKVERWLVTDVKEIKDQLQTFSNNSQLNLLI